jgi:hypothetical protein
VCEHGGLIGGHREELHRIYLSEVLPQRFRVGRGMVYGPFHRSGEADIVIWDGANFPSLPMLDHRFYFAESVRLVIESKSTWSVREFDDVLAKAEAVRNIIATPEPGLPDQLLHLEMAISSLQTGTEHDGFIQIAHHVGTAAIFLRGGSSFNLGALTDDQVASADDRFPDLLLFLDHGTVVVKDYGDPPVLVLFEAGEDCLALFTRYLLLRISERSVNVEPVLDMFRYLPFELQEIEPVEIVDFPLRRMRAGREPLWRTPMNPPANLGSEPTE